MEAWTPITPSRLESVTADQLKDCEPMQRAVWDAHHIAPYRVLIMRGGKPEHVFVVARKEAEVLYFEGGEDGFNIARLTKEGGILEPGHKQGNLRRVLQLWK
jgi:hypothetical protein